MRTDDLPEFNWPGGPPKVHPAYMRRCPCCGIYLVWFNTPCVLYVPRGT